MSNEGSSRADIIQSSTFAMSSILCLFFFKQPAPSVFKRGFTLSKPGDRHFRLVQGNIDDKLRSKSPQRSWKAKLVT